MIGLVIVVGDDDISSAPVSRYFSTTVEYDKRNICTGLISIQ